MRALLIVLDSVGIGAAADAHEYGDGGAATLQHIAEHMQGLQLPNLKKLGLGLIPALVPGLDDIKGLEKESEPLARYGIMQECSVGKDTITGHLEIAGIELNPGFHLFPDTYPSFPQELTAAFEEQTGRKILGNKHGSGTAIIEELGECAFEQGAYIVYTSADSVFQIAAHSDVITLEEHYEACRIARALCNPYRVGRVIARPFVGPAGNFIRTEKRKDYPFLINEKTVLELLAENRVPVYAVGKINDIYSGKGIKEYWHTGNNLASQAKVIELLERYPEGLIFANFIDFDMLYGHRRDIEGYAACLEQCDAYLRTLLECLSDEDLLIITADHGNDPSFPGTDHTREYVPLLCYQKNVAGKSLGLRHGFYDIAQSLATFFGLAPLEKGQSFI